MKKTPISKDSMQCIHCKEELLTVEEAYPTDIETPIMMKFRISNSEVKTIEKKDLDLIIAEHFKVKNFTVNKNPIYIVESPENDIQVAFEELSEKIFTFLPNHKVRMRYMMINRNLELSLTLFNIIPIREPARRLSIILFFVTTFSIFLAGIYNFSKIKIAKGGILINEIWNFEFSNESFIHSAKFSFILILILTIKDFPHLLNAFRKRKSVFISYFIPAPPIFELGTLGSIVTPATIPKNNNDMFNRAFIGPFIAWLFSVLLFFITLKSSTYDPKTGDYFQDSTIYNGNYQPLLFKILLPFTDYKLPLSSNYILNPFTFSALIGIYICGIYLLPASNLNGGYILKAATGESFHRFSTIVVILSLSFYFPYIGLLLMLSFYLNKSPMTLDEVTKISRKKKILAVISILFSVLSFPVVIS